MIRKGKASEIDTLLRLTQACAKKMMADGIFQWNELYPSKEAFELDNERGELYVLEHANRIIGCITLSATKDAEYDDITWLTPDGDNYYVHRLAIHPEFQRQGHAKKLMDFVEAKAKEFGATSIRLDTFSQNKRNQKFYKARGYEQLGNIYFPKQSALPFYCFEKVF